MKEAKRKQKEFADRNSKEEHFQIRDPVYLNNHKRTSKLNIKWKWYYRITDHTGPLMFVSRNQLDGTTTKIHARHATRQGRRMESTKRYKRTYVVPPGKESSSEEETTPLQKIIRHKQQKTDGSSDEDDIPTMELRGCLRSRDTRQKEFFNEDHTPKYNPVNNDYARKSKAKLRAPFAISQTRVL